MICGIEESWLGCLGFPIALLDLEKRAVDCWQHYKPIIHRSVYCLPVYSVVFEIILTSLTVLPALKRIIFFGR
jgi:hypothetical protein